MSVKSKKKLLSYRLIPSDWRMTSPLLRTTSDLKTACSSSRSTCKRAKPSTISTIADAMRVARVPTISGRTKWVRRRQLSRELASAANRQETTLALTMGRVWMGPRDRLVQVPTRWRTRASVGASLLACGVRRSTRAWIVPAPRSPSAWLGSPPTSRWRMSASAARASSAATAPLM